MSSLVTLSPDEESLLRDIAANQLEAPAGSRLCIEGYGLDHPVALIAGWACSLRTLSDGRRQIFGFILPGDVVGLRARTDALSLHSVLTLTAVKIADATRLGAVISHQPEQYKSLARACAMAASLEEAYLLDHIVRLGRQTAYERIAHLLLELAFRLNVVGLADEARMPMPLTQDVMADALGLSLVHVNRTLQQLRRDRLIELKGPSLSLLQPEALISIAHYRPPKVAFSDVT